jgi:type VI secretion system protein ImpK
LSAGALDAVGLGLGPLVRAASPLLLLAGQLRGTLSGPDVQALRRHGLEEIRRFEDRARASGIQNETVLAARYAICAALDEAVLSTPWGAQSEWTQQSLLVALHREAWGGEKFFEMLDRVSRDPKHHIDLMEILYLCLAMGFAGKYQVATRGQSQLLDIQHDLFRKIREYRGVPPAELSPRWKGIQDRRNRLIRYVPWWVVGAAVAGVLVIAFAMFRMWLGPESEGVRAALAALRTAEAPLAVSGDGLAQYLKPEIASGALTVEGGSKVVLRDFFASASDRFAGATAATTLTAVCAALDKFPQSRIRVVGHTDSLQPKARFGGNQELSERRAENVAEYLRGGNCLKTDPNRVSPPEGKGSAEAFKPDSAENRAKSRRVEIILVGRF